MTLPVKLVDELCRELPRFNAIPLITLDPEGFPHVALLSYFELIFYNQRLYFFLHSSSCSTKFLHRRTLCTLIFVQNDFVYYMKARVSKIGECDLQTIFRVKVVSVLEDFPSAEEGAVFLKTGIRFASGEEETERRLELRKKITGRISNVE
ncbi:hypothetical protein MYX84_10125 [Acidobacteria bacterium AH-259-O06]|nr:hypothetical protein [Acidobacteria bacterium AH-259-O06]